MIQDRKNSLASDKGFTLFCNSKSTIDTAVGFLFDAWTIHQLFFLTQSLCSQSPILHRRSDRCLIEPDLPIDSGLLQL